MFVYLYDVRIHLSQGRKRLVNPDVTYSLRNAEGMFDINHVSGEISVAKKLDREQKDLYKVSDEN